MVGTPLAHVLQPATMSRLSSSRQWPGEWDPTGLEVHEANQSPENAFRERFKVALLQSEDGQEYLRREPSERYHVSLATDEHGHRSTLLESPLASDHLYTYPMSMLSDVPMIPDPDEVARLQSAFFTSFKQHIYLPAIAIPDTTLTSPAPYLQLALACVAAEISSYADPVGYNLGMALSGKTEVAAALFHAGTKLWGVVMEVDNRETRRLETVITAYLLATYGMLSLDKKDWKISGALLHNTATMARRIRLTDGFPQTSSSGESSDRSFRMKSSLVAYMFLTDVVYSIYCDAAPTYSSNEMYIKMPSSRRSFREVYSRLVHGHTPLPSDVNSREDSLLLLTALLNDIMYLHRCNQKSPSLHSDDAKADRGKPLRNPYAPLTAPTEFSRMTAQISAALERWEKHFGQLAGKDILALYHFSRLCLICPEMSELPNLAGYDPGAQATFMAPPQTKQSPMSDKALDLAWLVLDSCDIQSEPVSSRLSVWLPVVLFYSALVIWQRLRNRSSNDFKYGTLKVLSMFKNEILQLPWPCCSPMAVTLDKLMKE